VLRIMSGTTTSAAGAARDRGDNHRQPGYHQWRIFDDPPGDPARLVSAHAHHPDLGRGLRTNLCWLCQLALDDAHARADDHISLVGQFAAAFGIAVSLTMLLTSVLMFRAMRDIWHWRLAVSLIVAGLFVTVDLSFVTANMMKIFEGGWVPLVVGATIFFLMWTWRE